MKKLGIITLLLAMMGIAFAKPVSQDVARRVAQTWMQAQGMKNPAALQDITSQTPFTEFYVFAAEEGGFIIVSGDDCVRPVLGYSLTSRFDTKRDIPVNVRGWLDDYEKEIRHWKNVEVRYGGVHLENNEAVSDWQMLANGEMPPAPLTTAVSPLVSTTWDQSPYYNALCPYDAQEAYSGNHRVVTGCVATATAQIMKFWNHPTTGYGSHSYVHYNDDETVSYGTLSANFGNTTYLWNNMPNELTASSSDAQVNAVATLMYHIGVADEMIYDLAINGGSGAHNHNTNDLRASSQSSLMAYFKYRPDMTVICRDDYSYDEYCSRLRAELDQQRPILYSGSGNGGHSFVCDGYNEQNQFRINWGWGGYYDGYFSIGAFTPGGGGAGSNSNHQYSYDNIAILGIRPYEGWSTTATTTVGVTMTGGNADCHVYGAGTYNFGDTINLEAQTPDGYRFAGWTDGDRNNNRALFASGGTYNFTATFEPLQGDTLSYCRENSHNLTRYGTNTWGIKLPASTLTAGHPLTSAMLYVGEVGTYTLKVYLGSDYSNPVATSQATYIDSTGLDQWNTFTLTNNVTIDGTQDIIIAFTCNDANYPATVTHWCGNTNGFLYGSGLQAYGNRYTFMIRGIFGDGNGQQPGDDCMISTFPYTEGFEDINTLGCWNLLDNDGDGAGWFYYGRTDSLYGHNSNYCLASASWDGSALTPDNWLFMPAMQLPAGQQIHLKWWVKGMDPDYAAENYSVMISTTGGITAADVSSYSSLLTETTTGSWVQKDINLSSYAGQTVYIAFRHHNVTDMFYLVIDDVEVTATNSTPTQYTITVGSNNSAWGTVTGGGTYNSGATVTLTATANTGYHFVEWQDGNQQNPRTITVTGNAAYMATFEADAAPQDSCLITTFPYTEGFEDNNTLGCWYLLDNDGDGGGWFYFGGTDSLYGHNSNYCLASASWFDGFALTPDNWLFMPAMQLPAGQQIHLKWWVKGMDPDYAAENYSVMISTTGGITAADVSSYSSLLTETTTGSWVQKDINLSSYAGQTVYIAFRHHNVTDMFYLVIDDVEVTATNSTPTQYTITVGSNNSAWGTVTGGGTYNSGATVTLTATANTGYHFVEWQDGNTQNPRTITVMGNATYTATFEADANPGTNPVNEECVITSFPYSEDFDGEQILCWSTYDLDNDVDNNNGANAWFFFEGIGTNSSAAAGIGNNNGNDYSGDYLMSPLITTPGTYTATWQAKAYAEATLYYYAMAFDWHNMEPMDGYVLDSVTTTAWDQHSFTFTVSQGDTVRLAFLYITTGGSYLIIDDVDIATSAAPQPTQYTITLVSNNNAWGTVSGGGTYNEGATATLTATAASGYHFVQWQDGNTQNPRTITVNGNATYIAIFEANPPTQYTVTATSNNTAWGTVTGSGIYDEGMTAILIATANEGYHFVSWNDGNMENPRVVTVNGDASYIAIFEEIPPTRYTITVMSSNPVWGAVTGGGEYDEGTEVTLSANAAAGCRFVRWNDQDTHATRTITVTGNAYYVAIFDTIIIPRYTIIVSSNNDAWGTVSGGGEYETGTSIQLTATPAEGCHFVQWNDMNTETVRTVMVTSNASYTATFAQNGSEITFYTVTVLSNDETMGSVSGSGTYAVGSQVVLTATPVQGYHFVQWNDGNDNATRTVTVTGDITYTAYFEANPVVTYNVTALSNNDAWGTVSGSGTYNEGEVAILTALPNQGYHFAQWNDGNVDNPRIVNVSGNASYTAYFEADAPTQYTLTVVSNNPAWGTVTGGGTYAAGTPVELTATPEGGYHFVNWSDGNTNASRVVTVTENAVYVATFEANPAQQYTLTVLSNDTLMGRVIGEGVYNEGTAVTIGAIPNSGYHFVQWNDGDTNAYRVIVVTQNATYVATFAANTGIDDVDALSVMLYPNPTSNYVTISGLNVQATVTIVDATGRQQGVYTATGEQMTLDVSGLSVGQYFLRIAGNGCVAVKKLIIE